MRTRFVSLVIAALVAGTIAAPVAAAGVTRMVDDDGKASPGSCSGTSSAFKKIQNAVNASGKNDRVLVCPGTYRGTVTIPASKDGLRLQSVTHGGATIRSPKVGGGGDAAIVTIANGADDVTIADFRVLHVAPDLAPAGACGWAIGIRVRGADARIEDNTVIATGAGTLTPCGLETGILVEGTGSSATVRYNVVRDFALAGIVVLGAGNRLVAFRNIVRFYHLDAEQPFTAAGRRSLVRGLRLTPAGSGSGRMGIGVLGGSASVEGNTVASHPSRGPLSEVEGPNPYLSSGIIVTPSDAASSVQDNRVYRTTYGILLATSVVASDLEAVTTTGNLALSNVFGIRVDAFGGYLTGNRAFGNVYGIYAGQTSSANTFVNNEADGNADDDCRDETSGPANQWTGNIGDSASPDEICDPEFI